jgi:glycosyltransferase involved in cell wall biosynthesis
LAGRVHFTGWWADVPAALADLDVVALASRNEGTPIVLVEALASARPVVATDVGGVRAIVQDKATGRLCAPGDAAGMARALLEALHEPALARRRAQAGRTKVAERFGAARMAKDHRALYERLLAGDAKKMSNL